MTHRDDFAGDNNDGGEYDGCGDGLPNFDSLEDEEMYFATNIIGAVIVIGCVAIIAGLFLGLLTLDAFDLQIKERSSLDPDERTYASALYPIVVERHLLLVTLLILNSLAYEALPIFLDKLVPGWVAILLSTTLVLFFGEILPTAYFTGPRQLKLGYRMVPLVKALLFIMYPIAKPLSMVLDSIVHLEKEEDDYVPGGEEAYNRGELAALVKIQYEERMKQQHHHQHNNNRGKYVKKKILWDSVYPTPSNDDTYHALKKEMLLFSQDDETSPDLEQNLRPPMEKQEVKVVLGALQLKTRVAMDVYTPLRHVYAISDNLVLHKDTVASIYGEGFSRVPVYHHSGSNTTTTSSSSSKKAEEEQEDDESDRSAVCGFVMTRQLMLIDWDDERPVSTLPLIRPDAVSPRMNLVRLLHVLRQGGSHMAFVCARPDLANRSLQMNLPIPIEAGFMGLVTLEDIMESILQTRIYDETDIRDRELAIATLQQWAISTLQRFARKKKTPRRPSPQRRRTIITQEDSNNNKDTTTNDVVYETTPLLKNK